MNSVAGIFLTRAAAQSAIDRLRELGIDEERMILLSPGTSDERVEQTMPRAESEEAGTGEKIGSSVGRGTGIAGGIMLGGAVGSIVVPGVGAVLAAGVLGAALLGTMGAAVGAAVGSALDEKASASLRHDELHLYEAALRQGRNVLIAIPTDESQARVAREALKDAGAESPDEARELWWRNLRAAEEDAYRSEGKDFSIDENLFRRGFEASLHPRARGLTLVQSVPFLREYFPEDYRTAAFQSGYQRGQIYQQKFLDEFPPTA
jgi:hypothetical protein